MLKYACQPVPLLEVVEPLRSEVMLRELVLWEDTIEEAIRTLKLEAPLPLIFVLGYHEVNRSPPPCTLAMMHHSQSNSTKHL